LGLAIANDTLFAARHSPWLGPPASLRKLVGLIRRVPPARRIFFAPSALLAPTIYMTAGADEPLLSRLVRDPAPPAAVIGLDWHAAGPPIGVITGALIILGEPLGLREVVAMVLTLGGAAQATAGVTARLLVELGLTPA